MKELKIAELFAGVGGFRLGFERADKNFFKTVFMNQWEPSRRVQDAFDVYVKNFGDSKFYENEDISIVNDRLQENKKSIPDFDILVGGFPCQDYSVASTKAKGIRGKKGILWWEIERMIRYKNPKYLLLENVDRLIKSPSDQRGRDFLIMLKVLHEMNFNVEWNVINGHDYGHVQKRKRIYIFAWKKNDVKFKNLKINETVLTENFNQKLKEETKIVNENILKKSLNTISKKSIFKFHEYGTMINGKISTWRYEPIYDGDTSNIQDILQNDNKVTKNYVLTSDQKSKVFKMKDGGTKTRITKDGFKYKYTEGKMMRYDDNKIRYARTLLTSEGTVNRSSHIIKFAKDKARFITPIEAERINEFPDDWTSLIESERTRYFLMGNALIVGIIEKIGKTLKEKLN